MWVGEEAASNGKAGGEGDIVVRVGGSIGACSQARLTDRDILPSSTHRPEACSQARLADRRHVSSSAHTQGHVTTCGPTCWCIFLAHSSQLKAHSSLHTTHSLTAQRTENGAQPKLPHKHTSLHKGHSSQHIAHNTQYTGQSTQSKQTAHGSLLKAQNAHLIAHSPATLTAHS